MQTLPSLLETHDDVLRTMRTSAMARHPDLDLEIEPPPRRKVPSRPALFALQPPSPILCPPVEQHPDPLESPTHHIQVIQFDREPSEKRGRVAEPLQILNVVTVAPNSGGFDPPSPRGPGSNASCVEGGGSLYALSQAKAHTNPTSAA